MLNKTEFSIKLLKYICFNNSVLNSLQDFPEAWGIWPEAPTGGRPYHAMSYNAGCKLFPHPQLCSFAQPSCATQSRTSLIMVCKAHWCSLEKSRRGHPSRDLLLHSCWHLPFCQYFFSYINSIFTPWSGLCKCLQVRAVAGNIPPLKKWGFASNYVASTLLAHCLAMKDEAVFTNITFLNISQTPLNPCDPS